MGNDQHGPAYPEPTPYRCPICHGDKDRYSTCEYPGCFDGRDSGHPHAVARRHLLAQRERFDLAKQERIRDTNKRISARLDRETPSLTMSFLGWIVAVSLLAFSLWPTKAPAMDHGFDPNSATTKWFESLQRPDRPGSCCGKADAYPVTYAMNPDGSAEVTVTDGSDKVYPDGYHRPAYTGGVITVPKDLINKLDDDLANPTDTSWIFMTVYGGEMGSFYCLIRHPEGN